VKSYSEAAARTERSVAMSDTIQMTSAHATEIAAAYTTTKAELLGEPSLRDDPAEMLGLAEEDHKTIKITAADVENDCPVILQDLGKRIAAHWEKARKCEEKAAQHDTSIAKLLVNAKQVCDEGGFTAFRERFCPKLSQSRAYELLSVANNKKSVEEIRGATRARVAKHRANKAADSVTVTESTKPAHEALTRVGGVGTIKTALEQPEPAESRGTITPNDGALNHADSVTVTESTESAQEAATPVDGLGTINTVAEQRPEPAKPRRAVARNDGVNHFSEAVVELVRRTRKCKPEHFAETSVSADDLAELGKFLTDLAVLKNSRAMRVSQGNAGVSAEESAEEMKAKFAALEAAATVHAHCLGVPNTAPR
jgi:hypothetical protein